MVSYNSLQKLALSFPETFELPHFEKTSFRVNKKIFATYDKNRKVACLKLSPEDQDIFSLADREHIYPVPNKWGQQGWTYFDINFVRKEVFSSALEAAYLKVAPESKKGHLNSGRT